MPTIAFPGADGFGKYATGARASDAQVIFVSNLNNSGAGSLREALQATGNRYIVPTVPGICNLSSEIVASNSNFTFLGQLAPYPGFTVAGTGIRVTQMNNFIIRYLRIKVGDARKGAPNIRALTINDAELGIVDHCSFAWGLDETFSGYNKGGPNWQTQGLSYQWCIVAEPLNDPIIDDGVSHGYAMLHDGNHISFHHNLICHAASRCPQWFDRAGHPSTPSHRKGLLDFRNNLVYNWKYPMRGTVRDVNIINNMYITGPAAIHNNRFYHRPELSSQHVEGQKLHASGNKLLYVYKTLENLTSSDGHNESWEDNRLGIRNNNGTAISLSYFTYTPHPVPSEVYDISENPHDSALAIMNLSGMRLYRDTHDARYMTNVINGDFLANGSNGSTDGVIDSQNDVGGWWNPTHQTGDHDIDGISIAWKNTKGLPVGTNVANLYTLDPDYPNIEVYANELVEDFVYNPTHEPPPPPAEEYHLSLVADPIAYGTLSQTPTSPHEEGTVVTLTATPADENKKFDGWFDGAQELSKLEIYNYVTLGIEKTLVGKFSDVEPDPLPGQIGTLTFLKWKDQT
jgi:hypothetical protein